MANIIQVKLSKNTSPNYADPNDVIVYDGDQIQFTAIDADFIVTFPKPTMVDSTGSEVYKIKCGYSELTKGFKVSTDNYSYNVEKTDFTSKLDRAPAKMTVKAVITRNG
jgi:hypothetical protein